MQQSTAREPRGDSWWSGLGSYEWTVLVAASLGWMFDTMDQRLFVLARNPAIVSLLPVGTAASTITWYSGLATAIFMAGWAIGGFFFGIISDRWGRAKTMMVTILIYSAFTGLSALSTGWWDFAAYRFLTGLGVGGEFAAGVSLVAEAMPDRARPYALGVVQTLSALGNILGSLLSLVIMPYGWRYLFMAGVLPALLVAVMFNRLHEPEAWLRARQSGRAAGQQLGAVGDLFAPRWRKNTFVGLTLAICGVVGLWGIGFWSPELIREALRSLSPAEQSRYVSIGTLVQDAGAFLGIAAFTALTGRIGRRPAFVLGYLIGFAATVMTFGWLRTPEQMYWMIPLLGFCNLSVFAGFSIYFPELYPTRLRGTGVGFCYNVGRVIAALGPLTLGGLTVVFSDMGYASPFRAAAIALASAYLVGAVVSLTAPETKGKPLPLE